MIAILPIAPEYPQLDPRRLPIRCAEERACFVRDDGPAGDGKREAEPPDAAQARPGPELRVSRGLPDSRTPHGAERRGEGAVDPVERGKVVEQVVWVVDRQPPSDGGPGYRRGLAAREPNLGPEVAPVNDEPEGDVQAAGPVHPSTIPTGLQ